MYDKDMSICVDNSIDTGLNRIKNDPELQLKIIRHFFPEATPGKKFKSHKENTPSSSLKLDSGKYWLKNFGSGEKAKDWLNVVQDQLSCDASEALRFVLTTIVLQDIPLEPKPSKGVGFSIFEKKIYAIRNNAKKQASLYLKTRGIDVGALPEGTFYQSNSQDGLTSGIVFVDSEKRLINTRKLTLDKGQYYNDGVLYNSLYDAMYNPTDDWVFLVEGCINALSLQGHSSLAFFSADNNFNDYPKLEKYVRGKKVVLAFDNDSAGEMITNRMLSLIVDNELGNVVVSRLLLPPKVDLNDLLRDGQLADFLANGDNYRQLYPLLLEDSVDESFDFQKNGFFKRMKSYWVETSMKGEKSQRCISNFLMDVIYFFPDGSDNAKRIFYLQNKHGKSEMVSIPAKSLKIADFKAAIRSKGNFSFRGTVDDLDRILEEIFQRELEATELSVLGYQPSMDAYAFANGIIANGKFHKANKYGVVEFRDHCYYLPAFSFLNRHSQEYAQEQKFQFKPGDTSFAQWADLFVKAYDEKGIVGIVYALASVFRDIIFSALESFPYLFLFGDWGVGKTTYSELLLSLFYTNYKGISLEANSTPKSIARTAHKIRNGLLYLKEYNSKVESSIVGLLKTGYEGVAYSRAQSSNDHKTLDTFINSSIILDGNNLPSASSAQLSRMVVLDFRKNGFTSEQHRACGTLGQLKEDGFGNVLLEIINQRNHFKIHFKPCFDTVLADIRATGSNYRHMSERSIKHIALFLAVYKALESKLRFPFTYEELQDWVKRIISDQDEEVSSINRVNRFWRALDYLKSEGKLKRDIHYKYATRNDGGEYLALNVQLLHKVYAANSASWDGEFTEYNDLVRLILNDPAYLPTWMQGRGNTVTVKGFGSAYAFDINKIQLNLNLWER